MQRLFALLVLAALVEPVSAADSAAPAPAAGASKPAARKAAAPKPAASKPTKAAILTPAQLKQCETLKDKLRGSNDAALQAKKQLDAERAAIDASAAEIQNEQPTVDLTSQDAIDVFNAKVSKRDRSIDAYQAKVAAYNVQVSGLGPMKEEYEKACETRRFDERDLADIKRGKK